MKIVLCLLLVTLSLSLHTSTPTPDSQKLLANIEKLQADPCSTKAIENHKEKSRKLFEEIFNKKIPGEQAKDSFTDIVESLAEEIEECQDKPTQATILSEEMEVLLPVCEVGSLWTVESVVVLVADLIEHNENAEHRFRETVKIAAFKVVDCALYFITMIESLICSAVWDC
jgi:hypothetical protein